VLLSSRQNILKFIDHLCKHNRNLDESKLIVQSSQGIRSIVFGISLRIGREFIWDGEIQITFPKDKSMRSFIVKPLGEHSIRITQYGNIMNMLREEINSILDEMERS
jgi:hypothetical protein